MESTPARVQLSTGAYAVLRPDEMPEWTLSGPPRRIVDARNQPALSRKRRRALERLERFRWWEPLTGFPEAPDELRQLEALKSWFLGFGLTTAMLMAPVVACFAVLSTSRASVGMEPSVGTAIAIVSLMLLLLVLQRLARPVWGKTGDSALPLRRPFLLLLPAPVIATLWWLSYPMPGVRWVGQWFPAGLLLLLAGLVAWFLVDYFRYANQQPVWAWLDNADPARTVAAFYELLRPGEDRQEYGRRLETSVQYLEPFLRSTYLAGSNGRPTGSWIGPLAEHPRSLPELGRKLSNGLGALFQGERLLGLKLRGLVLLKPEAEGDPPPGLLACCALEARSRGGLGAGASSPRDAFAAERTERCYCCHRLRPVAGGWFFESGRFEGLGADDAARLRQAGVLP